MPVADRDDRFIRIGTHLRLPHPGAAYRQVAGHVSVGDGIADVRVGVEDDPWAPVRATTRAQLDNRGLEGCSTAGRIAWESTVEVLAPDAFDPHHVAELAGIDQPEEVTRQRVFILEVRIAGIR